MPRLLDSRFLRGRVFGPEPRGNDATGGLVSCVALAAVLLAGCGETLHAMAARGDLDAMRAALREDPEAVHSTDDRGKTPLHFAVSFKQTASMAFLVEAGADLEGRDKTGMTPLHVAAMLGRRDEAQWLLDHGADLHARDDFGDEPVHTAAIFGHGHVVKLLLDHGARLDVTNTAGETPLDLARRHHRDRAAVYIEKLSARRTQ